MQARLKREKKRADSIPDLKTTYIKSARQGKAKASNQPTNQSTKNKFN
jgi:hypothetical protein